MSVKSTLLPGLIPVQNNRLWNCFSLICLALLSVGTSQAQIRGKVFRDFNGSGTRDSSATFVEIGARGVTVTASDGTTSVTTTTSIFGDYAFPNSGVTASGKQLRIEFSDLTAGDFSGPQGTFSGTSVQFATAGNTAIANFGLNYPAQYCQSNPLVTTSCFVAGRPAVGSQSGQREVLVSLPVTATGSPSNFNLANAQELGSIMGLAYHRAENKVYSAAFTKRHVGYGPNGPGAIYVSSLSANRQTATSNALFFNFGSTAGTDPHDANLPTTSGTASRENDVFDAVGKVGLGDIDISDDEKSLYVVNLFNRKLYRLDIATKDTVGYAIPNPCASGKSYRPFAVKFYRGKVYVGVVCSREDATTKTDTVGMKATVYQFDAGTFTPVLSFPLTYKKQASNSDKTGIARAEYWRPWTATFQADRDDDAVSYPQAWLVDIEFDVDGDMLLGVRDRFGDQMGHENYKPFVTSTALVNSITPGEILRAGKCSASADLWTIEQNGAVCGGTPSTAQNNQDGPGGGKYYFGDRVDQGANHGSSSMGGISLWAGSGRAIMTAIDPTDIFYSGGIKRLVNRTGAPDGGGGANGGAILYTQTSLGSYGKANGLGDIELLCDIAPIEIGNRVWLDQNNDGIQDPDEVGISGLTITLCLASAPTVPVATAITGANGTYYFSTAVGTNTASVKYGLNLAYDTDYILKFPVTSSVNPLTIKDNDVNDQIDSDAAADGTVAFRTGDQGQNSHTFDVGYSSCIKPVALATPKNQSLCVGQQVAAYTVTPATGAQYRWYGPLADTTSTLGTAITGATTATFTPSGAQIPASGVRYFAVIVNTRDDLSCADTAFVSLTVNVKPVVGNATICAPATTATLTRSPAGGTWTALAGNPVPGAVTSAGAVSGLTASGTYQFAYILNGCSDTATVVRNAKPSAGTDQTLACTDPVNNILTTSTTLVPVTTGGTWTQLGTSPAVPTVTGNGVTGMTVAGTYQFIYDVLGCKDTVSVTVSPCAGCVKPDAGLDITLNCPATGMAPTTATLVPVTLGGTWAQLGSTPAIATLTGNNVTNMIVSGIYQFVYSVSSGGQICTDTVAVIVPTCVIPVGSLGDFVWKDLNDNGQQDSGEPGVNGVKVILWSAVGGSPSAKLDSVNTAGNGAYSFTNLAKGTYIVQIDVATLPDSCVISTKPNVGSDVTDNDFTTAGLSPVVSLDPTLTGPSKDNPTIDAGLISPKGSLGDFVWKDLNDNGQQDRGEPGVNGVKVILWSAVGGSPSAKLDSVNTAGNGAYSFTNLAKGTYIVQIDVATLPDSCVISTKPNVGSDVTDNDFTTAGLSPVVSLDPTLTGLNKDNPTIDAGLVTVCIKPVIGAIRITPATCADGTSNGNAAFTVGGISGGDRFSTATTLAGLAPYASATALTGGSISLSNLPNPAGPVGQTYFVRVYNGATDCFRDTTLTLSFIDCGGPCYTITSIEDARDTLCSGYYGEAMSVKVGNNADVRFVRFNSPQTPVSVYTGGTLLETVTPTDSIAGWPNGIPGSQFPANTTNAPVNYYVYAISADPTGLPENCRPFAEKVYTVLPLPVFTQTTEPICIDSTTYGAVVVLPAGVYTVTVARGLTTVGNGPVPQDIIETRSGVSGSTLFALAVADSNAVVVVQNQVTGCASVRPLIDPRFTECTQLYDLALDKAIDKKLVMLGETVNYTIRVWNEGKGNATGVEVTDSLNAGVQYVTHATAAGNYNPATKIWTIGNLAVGDTVTLTIAAKVVAQGVWFNTAEITKINENDDDSTPGNGTDGEDDIDRECFTVPILVCRGQDQAVQLSVPVQYAGVVWFRKTQGGQPVQVATGNRYTATETELGSYEYTYTSTVGSCPAEGCCPIVIVVEDCCPAQICVPFTVKKTKL